MKVEEIKRDLANLWQTIEYSDDYSRIKLMRYKRAFQQLGEPYATVMRMRYLERKTYKQIAQKVAYVPKSIRNHLVPRAIIIISKMFK